MIYLAASPDDLTGNFFLKKNVKFDKKEYQKWVSFKENEKIVCYLAFDVLNSFGLFYLNYYNSSSSFQHIIKEIQIHCPEEFSNILKECFKKSFISSTSINLPLYSGIYGKLEACEKMQDKIYLMQQKNPQTNLDSYINSINPVNTVDLWARGRIYANLRKYSEALLDLDLALSINQQDAFTLKLRAIVYSKLGRFDEALQDLDATLMMDQFDFFSLKYQGILYAKIERFNEALQNLDLILVICPLDLFSLKYRGAIYAKLRRFDEALQDFEAILMKDPFDFWALKYRGTIYAKLKKFDEALQDLNIALSIDPSDIIIKKILNSIKAKEKSQPVAPIAYKKEELTFIRFERKP